MSLFHTLALAITIYALVASAELVLVRARVMEHNSFIVSLTFFVLYYVGLTVLVRKRKATGRATDQLVQ